MGNSPQSKMTGDFTLLEFISTVDQSSIQILILLVFLPQIPRSTCHTSADTKQQQPDQRVPVITGLRCGRCLLWRLCAGSRCRRIRRVCRIIRCCRGYDMVIPFHHGDKALPKRFELLYDSLEGCCSYPLSYGNRKGRRIRKTACPY